MDALLLVFSVLMLSTAFFSASIHGELVSSTVLYPACWGAVSLICSFAYYDVSVSFWSVSILAIAILMSVLGGIIGRAIATSLFRDFGPARHLGLNVKILLKLFWFVFFLVALIQYLIFLLISELPVLSAYENSSAALYASTQSGFELPFGLRMAVSLFYFLPALGGVICAYFSIRRSMFVFVASFLPSLIMMLMFTTKGSLIFCVLCFASAHLATKSCFHKLKADGVNWGAVFLSAILIFVSILFASWIRYGYSELGDILLLLKKARVDYFGSLYAFSVWLDGRDSMIGGADRWILFAGVMEMVGVQDRVIGNFDSGIDFPGGGVTNIYTLFRGVFSDFGVLGGVVVMFFSSLIYEYCLVSMKRRRSIVKIIVVSTGMMVILWSPIVFPFTYNTLIACFMTLFAALALSRLLYKRDGLAL